MSDIGSLAAIMRDMLDGDVIVGSALASTGIGGLDDKAYRMVLEQVDNNFFASSFLKKPIVFPLAPEYTMPFTVARNALIETISSTGAYYSHLKLGYLNFDESLIAVASKLVEHYINIYSADEVFSLMFTVNAYDDFQLIHHYVTVEEAKFITGELHRPWIGYTLEDELNLLIEIGSVKRDGSTISLTDKGEDYYQKTRGFLDETGYIQKRTTLMRFALFGLFEEYDQVVNAFGNFKELREIVLRRSDIQPGMHVLELGCGTGAMTFDSGLYRLVGEAGQVTATDPSLGMLVRAENKKEQFSAYNVDIINAPAEKLPFKESSFDAVVGMGFLHFTDIHETLREIHRVAKPGAILTTIYALKFSQSNPFFNEWFAPVLGSNAEQSDMFPDSDLVGKIIDQELYEDIEISNIDGITDYRNVESVVKFLVQVGNFFESTMNELPWQARQDMVQLLIERGHQIQQRYLPGQLKVIHPSQFLKARVRKYQ